MMLNLNHLLLGFLDLELEGRGFRNSPQKAHLIAIFGEGGSMGAGATLTVR
ncbi:hypothetical protein Fmac_012795 [Flemingia macrophylla]|uniref:Uncharacterized protein n=1 Tax=Flemingia macrophylla TaxID=520843 RepID=A0ABD1MRD2_9FABA